MDGGTLQADAPLYYKGYVDDSHGAVAWPSRTADVRKALAQNAKDVARLGKDLHDRIVTLGEHGNKVGERLGRTLGAYNIRRARSRVV